jgi:hypothetical protein
LARGAKVGGFAGQLSLFGVPDLLQFLCAGRRTGVITFSSPRGNARIRLYDGSLYWATSPAHPSIVEFLVEREAVAKEQPNQIAEGHVDEVSALVEETSVDVEKMASALRDILHSTVKDLVDWSDGWFMFDRIPDAAKPRPELLFSVQGILLGALSDPSEEQSQAE